VRPTCTQAYTNDEPSSLGELGARFPAVSLSLSSFRLPIYAPTRSRSTYCTAWRARCLCVSRRVADGTAQEWGVDWGSAHVRRCTSGSAAVRLNHLTERERPAGSECYSTSSGRSTLDGLCRGRGDLSVGVRPSRFCERTRAWTTCTPASALADGRLLNVKVKLTAQSSRFVEDIRSQSTDRQR